MKKINKTLLFLLLTFLICYSMIGIYVLIVGRPGKTALTIMSILYMLMPMTIAIVIEKLIYKNTIKDRLIISFKFNKWFLVAWLITPIIGFITLGISLLLPDVTFSPEMAGMMERFKDAITPEQLEEMNRQTEMLPIHPVWLALISGMFAGLTINAVAGFGEELGWRGFLLRQLRNRSFWSASIIIGIIWGIWHAPLILLGHNYPQHPEWGVLLMTIFCIVLSPLFTYITIKAKSVIAAAIMHGTLNGTAGISIMLIYGGSDLTVGITGLTGIISLLLVVIIFFIYDVFISKEKIMISRIENNLFERNND